MSARGSSATAMEPLLAAVEESGVVAAGSGAMEQVLIAMEDHLGAILDHAEDEIREIDREVDRRSADHTAECRRQIAFLRAGVIERASTLAYSYESLLGLLDDAERTLDRAETSYKGR